MIVVRWGRFALPLVSLFALGACLCYDDDGPGTQPGPTPNRPPLAAASGPRAACPDSLFTLHAEASDPDGHVALTEWSIGGGEFMPVSAPDTSFLAPSGFNMDYPCILRVTDDSGAVALDTHHVILSWIRSPNGGEEFRVGDTLRLHLFAVRELVGFKLIVNRDDEMDLTVPGTPGSFSPANIPQVSFVVPDTIRDDFFGRVSTVSDSCRIRVFLYMNAMTFVQSAGFFRILPRL